MKLFKSLAATVCAVFCLFYFVEVSHAVDKMHVITTIFPEYDWVQTILGENPAEVEVIQLLDNGVDLHSYQPTADDILKLSTCDLFIYVGGESDEWVEDALNEARTSVPVPRVSDKMGLNILRHANAGKNLFMTFGQQKQIFSVFISSAEKARPVGGDSRR